MGKLNERKQNSRVFIIISFFVIFLILLTIICLEYIYIPWGKNEQKIAKTSHNYSSAKSLKAGDKKQQSRKQTKIKYFNALPLKFFMKKYSASKITSSNLSQQEEQLTDETKGVHSLDISSKIVLKPPSGIVFNPELINVLKKSNQQTNRSYPSSDSISNTLFPTRISNKITDKNSELFVYNKDKENSNIPFHNEMWERQVILEKNNKVLMKWNFTKEDITILVLGETRGYVGVGFAHSHGMTGADLIVGWVKDGKTYIKDLYAEHNGRPLEDEQQDYKLLFGGESETHTWFCVVRKLNTCDDQDLEITLSTFHILWALHSNDPENSSVSSFAYHSVNKGTRKDFLLNLMPEKPENFNEMESTDLLAPNITVKVGSSDHFWWCYLIKLPVFETQHQMIGYRSIIREENEEIVHHIALSVCKKDHLPVDIEVEGGHGCYLTTSLNRLQADLRCLTTTILIARGGPQETFYPYHVGIPFGSTKEQPMYIMLQIHYNLLGVTSDIFDNSGLRVYHTANLRPASGGIMYLTKILYQMIPPRAVDFPNVAICSARCTRKFTHPDGVHISGYMLHAHKIATTITLYHFRNGKELRRITDNHFDYEFHYLRFLKEEIIVLPNDTLVVECLYDSRQRDFASKLGLGTNDEMCIAYLFVYPEFDFLFCGSYMRPTEIHRVFNNIPELKIYETPFSFYQHLLYLAGIQMFAVNHNWTKSEITEFHDAMRYGEHFSVCHFADLRGIVHEYTRMPNTSQPKEYCPPKSSSSNDIKSVKRIN